MICKPGYVGSAWGRIRGKLSLTPEQAERMFGFTMNPDADGVIFRQYTYYDDNNHPHTGTFISNYFPASNPHTKEQQGNRGKMRDAVLHWQSLSDADKEEWDRKAQGKRMSGFNLHNRHFIKEEIIMTPIGSIIAWHKNFANTPALPVGWLECNGQVINDPQSPFNGQTLPDLNGDKRFLRGSSTSGAEQADEFKSHMHTPPWGTAFVQYKAGHSGRGHSPGDWDHAGTGTSYTGGTETRPINMAVVWIMRIK